MKKLAAFVFGFLTTFLVTFMVYPPLMAHSALGAANALMSLGMSPELAKYVTSALVNVDSSGNLVLPVATSKKLSVTVNGTEKASVSSTGVVTGAAGLVATAGGVTATAGDVTATAGSFIASAGGQTLHLQEGTAASACMGTATANGTTAVTVSTTCAVTGARPFISRSSAPSGTAICWATNVVNGVSFDLDCSGAETGTFNWVIFKEAA